ncbi:MAG: 3-coathanger stack domain-containing protein, partial [Emticicia sp.]|uniref:3-coathanger stack domain-containing protein n=1 Tax=Emticicia sp. TaxID=1930953 RepID=UPI003BA68650
ATGEIKAKPNAPMLNASPQTITIGQSSVITASGCNGVINWSNGSSVNPLTVSPIQTTGYTAICTQSGCESTVSTTAIVTVNTNEPCVRQISLSSTADDYSSGTRLKQTNASNGSITAANRISGTAKVAYESKVIELKPGFIAENGTVFSARIGGCN